MQILTDYEGRQIRLTDERLAHILEHPEMQGMELRIAHAVRHPERVLESLSDPQARLYYRFYVDTRVGGKHLCVAVKLEQNDAFILTAYLMSKPAGGRQLWPRKN